MADEVKKIIVEVDTDKTLKEVKDLKQQFTEAEDAVFALAGAGKQNTAEYRQATKQAAKLKQEVDNINESLDDLKPEATIGGFGRVVQGVASGFAGAQGAMALFGDESEDLQKTLVKVQAAMAFAEGIRGLADLRKGFALLNQTLKFSPIFLIASILIGIGVAVAAATKKFKFLNDTFDAIGAAIDWLIQGFKDFTDWIGISSFALDEAAEKELENITKVGDALQSKYDRQIALDRAAGKSTVETEKIKQRAIIETAVLEARLMEQALKRNGELTDEETERLDELLKIVSDAKLQIEILDIQETTKKKKELEQQAKDRKAEHAKQLADDKKRIADLATYTIQQLQKARDYAQQLKDLELKREEDAKAKRLADADAATAAADAAHQKKLAQFKEQADKEQALQDEIFERAQDIIAGQQALSDFVFALKMNNVKKGSKEEEKAARLQFKINKSLAIQSGVISTIQGVINALSAQSVVPEPFGTILKVATAASVGVAGAANVAKIASKQFSISGGGGGGGATVPSAPSISAPRLEAPGSGSTQLDANGQIIQDGVDSAPPIKAVVVETDITGTQNNVSQIEDKAEL